MVSVHLKKGYSLRIAGAPSPQSAGLTKPTHVAALPERIPFVKPRLSVKVDDRVQEIAKANDLKPGQVYSNLQKSGSLEGLEREITETKVWNFLKEQSTIEEVS